MMFVALFDTLIISLFIGGCLLLGLNFWSREAVPCSADEKVDLTSECRPLETPTSRAPEQSPPHPTVFPHDAQAEKIYESIDTAAAEQNHYAVSVSAALARSKRKVDG